MACYFSGTKLIGFLRRRGTRARARARWGAGERAGRDAPERADGADMGTSSGNSITRG